jgi:acyl-CoA-binding protein
MSDLKKQFEKAAKDVMNLAERPDNDTMLRPVQAGLGR